jgi:hypothetical protein
VVVIHGRGSYCDIRIVSYRFNCVKKTAGGVTRPEPQATCTSVNTIQTGRSTDSPFRVDEMTTNEDGRKAQLGTICGWLSLFLTLEQLVESASPSVRAAMASTCPAKLLAQFSVAIVLGVLAGLLKRRILFLLVLIPLLYVVALVILIFNGEA